MNVPLQPFFLAIANRCRGGLIKISSGQFGRFLCWALPFTAVLILSSLAAFNHFGLFEKIYLGIALLGANFGGACLPEWGKYDTKPNNWNPWMLTFQGFLFTAPGAVLMLVINPWISLGVVLGGLMIAPAYAIAWTIPSTIKGFEQGPPLGEIIEAFILGLFISIFSLI